MCYNGTNEIKFWERVAFKAGAEYQKLQMEQLIKYYKNKANAWDMFLGSVHEAANNKNSNIGSIIQAQNLLKTLVEIRQRTEQK